MKEITIYTLEELEEVNEEAFNKVLAEWATYVKTDRDYVPWSDETIDSLRHVVEACGATLGGVSICPFYGNSSITVKTPNIGTDTPDDWVWVNVLQKYKYLNDNGEAYFPGLCAFTGYCGDDDMLESVWEDVSTGSSLRDALHNLAGVAQKMMEDDIEQDCERESMLINWGEQEYTIDGYQVVLGEVQG